MVLVLIKTRIQMICVSVCCISTYNINEADIKYGKVMVGIHKIQGIS